MDQQVSKELIAIIAVLVTILNQVFALLRGKAETWMENKNGGSPNKNLQRLIDEVRGMRSDERLSVIESKNAHDDIIELVAKNNVMLSDWQRSIDRGEFGCKMTEKAIQDIHLCHYPHLKKD